MFEGVSGSIVVVLALVLLAVIVLAKTAIVVPQQSAYVVERLGRYAGTLDAGSVSYTHLTLPTNREV